MSVDTLLQDQTMADKLVSCANQVTGPLLVSINGDFDRDLRMENISRSGSSYKFDLTDLSRSTYFFGVQRREIANVEFRLSDSNNGLTLIMSVYDPGGNLSRTKMPGLSLTDNGQICETLKRALLPQGRPRWARGARVQI
jgi:hypothetical protein